MRVYLSGPMSGLPNLNFEAFDTAMRLLIAQGHDVVSPADLNRKRGLKTYEEYLREDIRLLLDCDTIYLLHGWETSYGAQIELHVARAIGLKIMYDSYS